MKAVLTFAIVWCALRLPGPSQCAAPTRNVRVRPGIQYDSTVALPGTVTVGPQGLKLVVASHSESSSRSGSESLARDSVAMISDREAAARRRGTDSVSQPQGDMLNDRRCSLQVCCAGWLLDGPEVLDIEVHRHVTRLSRPEAQWACAGPAGH